MDKGCGVGVAGVGIDDLGEGTQCSNHPYRNSPGGICAFCLQEKLGKLVSSSKSNPSFFPIPPSSSSSSPSFRSEGGGAALGFAASSSSLSHSLSLSVPPSSSSSNGNNHRHPDVRGRIPFSSVSQKKTKKIDVNSVVVLKRSKSSAAPRRHHHLLEADEYSPRKRSGFWSFLHLTSSRRRNSSSNINRDKGDSKPSVHPTPTSGNVSASGTHAVTAAAAAAAAVKEKDKRVGGESSSSRRVVVGTDYGDENESPNSSSHDASSSSFGRKVARSRSVGCGSRSFSGDFLERISTGFGDCTLRRVESQREAKQQASKSDRMKERVRCGGIFGGFSMTSSSSYWATESDRMNGNVVHRTGTKREEGGLGASSSSSSSSLAAAAAPHGRNKSWGWAFASPMRAFRPSSSKPAEDKDSANAAKRSTNYQLHLSNNNTDADANVDADAAVPVPNLSAIPSLLTVGG